MLYGLKQEMELKNPKNRRIVRAYIDAEVRRLDKAVYTPLEKRYPYLNRILEEKRKGYDPIERMEEIKSKIQMIEPLKGLAGLIDLIGEDENMTETKIMINTINPLIELYRKFFPIEEQFYVDLAHAVKGVSAQRGVGIESIVGNLKYMDEVSRIVIPTREEAESFLRASQTHDREVLDIIERFFAEKMGKINEDLKEKKLMLTAKEIEVIQKAIWDYKMQEFDRVYST